MTAPRIVRWAFICLAIGVAVAAYIIWGFIEASRLQSAIDEIGERGEPTSAAVIPQMTGGAAQADRYYRAAAVLAENFAWERGTPLGARIIQARHDGVWPADLVADIKTLVERRSEALAFADKAAELPFDSARSTRIGASLGGLFEVQTVLGLRAVVRALDGDGEGAAASLFSRIQAMRPRGAAGFVSSRSADDVQTVFERVRPSSRALAPLAEAVSDVDDDNAFRQGLLESRALQLDRSQAILGRTGGWVDWVARPWTVHWLNRQLRTHEALVAAASLPWPEKIERYIEVGARPEADPWMSRGNAGSFGLANEIWYSGEELAVFRCMRTAIAIERYRRDHGEEVPPALAALVPNYLPAVPVDPFTGRRLLFVREPHGYSIYSVGHDGKDDYATHDLRRHGVMSTVRARPDIAADVGLQIAYR